MHTEQWKKEILIDRDRDRDRDRQRQIETDGLRYIEREVKK